MKHYRRQVNKNDYIMFTGDMNARVGHNKVTNIEGINGEAALNSIGKKLIEFCTFSNIKIHLLSIRKTINLLGKLEGTNQLLIFLTNMKTSKVIKDIRVCRTIELDSDHIISYHIKPNQIIHFHSMDP